MTSRCRASQSKHAPAGAAGLAVVDMGDLLVAANSTVTLSTAYTGRLGAGSGLYQSDMFTAGPHDRQFLMVTQFEVSKTLACDPFFGAPSWQPLGRGAQQLQVLQIGRSRKIGALLDHLRVKLAYRLTILPAHPLRDVFLPRQMHKSLLNMGGFEPSCRLAGSGRT